jgi:hypothetical protein
MFTESLSGIAIHQDGQRVFGISSARLAEVHTKSDLLTLGVRPEFGDRASEVTLKTSQEPSMILVRAMRLGIVTGRQC